MQVLESPPSHPAPLAAASVTPESRESRLLARSTPLGELEFFGGPGLRSVELRLPPVESIGDKATVLADTLDDNGNILQIAFTFERVYDNLIRVLAGRPGTGNAFTSVFDINLDEAGIIRGIVSNLDGHVDAVMPLTLNVPANAFGVLPQNVRLSILSLGGDGGSSREEETVSFLTPPLSLNTLLTAQTSPDPS